MISSTARFQQPTESETRILSHVLRGREVSQPALAKATGLSQQTVSRLCNELIDRGALCWGQRQTNGKRGQPSTSLKIEPGYAYSLGIALMTDAMSVLLMDFSGHVVAYRQENIPQMTRAAVFSRLRNIVDGWLAQHDIARDKLFGAGVGISGYCLDGKSRFNPPYALEDWAMVPLDTLFSDELGLPVWAENDGNAAAIGESLLGVGRSYSDFVYLFIAAGIGGGVVNNHRLWRGIHGNGGEIGLLLPREIFRRPALEALFDKVSGAGIPVEGISDMLANFDPNWPGVDEWIEEARLPFSMVASSIAALLDPQAIVLGGRIPPVLAERIIDSIEIYDHKRRAEPRPLPKLMLSQTEVDACAIGAAALPLERYFFTSML